MLSINNRHKFLFNFILIAFLLIAGCAEDDPVSNQEEHFEAIGMYFSTSGIKIAQILRGETSDTLVAPLGGLSEHIEIQFFDENENLIDPPTDDDKKLAWEIGNSNLAEIWQHEGEEGGYEFHLKGLHEGVTTIEFFVSHLGHNDYRSGNIPLKVVNEENAHGEPVGFTIKDEETGNTLATLNADGSVTGTLEVNAGETTEHMEVEFFDENGVEFQPASPHSLYALPNNTDKLLIVGQEEDEPWAFKLQGVSAGNTSVTFGIFYDGELEMTFNPIPVEVK